FGILSSGNSSAPATPCLVISATAKTAAAKILTNALPLGADTLDQRMAVRCRLGPCCVDQVAAVCEPIEPPALLDEAFCAHPPHHAAGKFAQLVLQVAVAHRPFQVAEGMFHMAGQLGAVL